MPVDFDVINYAPLDGWSPSRTVEAIVDHCFIVRLLEPDGYYHYAKPYVTAVTGNSVTFLWAYQIDPENRDLAPAAPGSDSEINVSSLSRDRDARPDSEHNELGREVSDSPHR